MVCELDVVELVEDEIFLVLLVVLWYEKCGLFGVVDVGEWVYLFVILVGFKGKLN